MIVVEKTETCKTAGGGEITFRYFEDETGHKYGVPDWEKALTEKPYGKIASYIAWGFTHDDLRKLAELHMAGFQRQKIEDLLVDCNFHTECDLFRWGKYEEALKS